MIRIWKEKSLYQYSSFASVVNNQKRKKLLCLTSHIIHILAFEGNSTKDNSEIYYNKAKDICEMGKQDYRLHFAIFIKRLILLMLHDNVFWLPVNFNDQP